MRRTAYSQLSSGVGSIAAVIINFQTPDLTERAVRTFRRFYPAMPLLLIDNGSADGSVALLRTLAALAPEATTVLANERNFHHGPAMDQAMRIRMEERILFLDSDCEVIRGGLVEMMDEAMGTAPGAYAAGKLIFMNGRGFDVPESPEAIRYLRPICLLVDRALYRTLPPFVRHGAPCLANMRAATERGLHLCDVPVDSYIRHEGRGTARRFGYRLGWKGRMNHIFNKLGW